MDKRKWLLITMALFCGGWVLYPLFNAPIEWSGRQILLEYWWCYLLGVVCGITGIVITEWDE